ncbi:MAG: hydrogenase [Myxococcales bacterium]|nr:hydrogenase [Myxococcales bacterium]
MEALVYLPLGAAVVALVLPWERIRPWLVPLGALGHFGLMCLVVPGDARQSAGGWLVLDALGKLVLATVSCVFAVASLYVPGYVRHFHHRRNRFFVAAMLGLLAALTLVVVAHHLGLMWVAIEASALATAPLLLFNRNARSLEATWKYLLLSSVGVALALLGSFFLAHASVLAGHPSTLLFEDLMAAAPSMPPAWLHAALAFLLLGYAGKMGLAPVHTWKPDAYGEAPGVVGMVLAGGTTSVAFLAVLRVARIAEAGGQGAHVRDVLVVLGLASMAVGAVFMLRQRDLKRMLAYSSVEHMGVLALAAGVGGPRAHLGALLYMIGNAASKGVLFLAAANIHRTYGSKQVSAIRGVLHRLPVSGSLFLAGFFAATGSPPFLSFAGLLVIGGALVTDGRWVVAACFLVLLFAAFLGHAGTVLGVVQGRDSDHGADATDPARDTAAPAPREPLWSVLPIGLLAIAMVGLGLWLPQPVEELLHAAVAVLEVHP